MKRFLLSTVALLLFAPFAQAQPAVAPAQSPKPIPSQDELDKHFSEALTGATLSGFFTTNGTDSDRPLKEDKYTLGRVTKLENGLWNFEAKMNYGGRDLTIPMALEVKWAGDTPMITLTDTTIPGLGTFTARVFMYDNQYAGTWKHGPAGGQMFGRVLKGDKKIGTPEPLGDTDFTLDTPQSR